MLTLRRRVAARLAEVQAASEAAADVRTKIDGNRARREEAEAAHKRHPVAVYVERLTAADEGDWKDFLEPMGAGPDIPKLFRTPAKVGACGGMRCCCSQAK